MQATEWNFFLFFDVYFMTCRIILHNNSSNLQGAPKNFTPLKFSDNFFETAENF